ncbi:stromal membrane-associated protein 1-like [Diorhabda carinulata]|uniref:stromal membrane-associated protein 1-like n=1 Tax=Diorhabda carinulata TaxID=1163345 RepID=UPI0025A20216|nr:stromal membrane-associated protein 1-like [Diorhabda carinulata]
MGSKPEKDKAKQLQDKCQSVLNTLLRDEDNKYCVDCDSKGPRWASWNIGVFLCIRCAGIHRNLGVHISKVKSVNLDSWTPEQVVSLQQMGNSRARAVYEANLPDNFRRPQSDSSLETFIRAKYEHKKYIAREWVAPPLPKVNWEKEIDEEIERNKRKKKTIVEKKPLGAVEVPQLPKPTNPSPKPTRSANSVDNTNKQEKKEKKDSDLLGLQNPEDNFSNFVSAPTSAVKQEKKDTVDSVKKEEESFFNQVLPTEKEKVKLDKDSIMALYGNGPGGNNFNQFPQPGPQGGFQGFGSSPNFQNAGFPLQNGGGMNQMPGSGQWPQQQQQQNWFKQQYPQGPPQNQVQHFTPNSNQPPGNQFVNNSFGGFPQQQPHQTFPQFNPPQQFQSPNLVGQQSTPNPFFNQTLPQQFSNLNMRSPHPQTSMGNLWSN